MKNKDSGLTQREKLFCVCFASTADIEHSAKCAGYDKEPLKKGQALLLKPEVADEIVSLSKNRERAMSEVTQLFYERLAFGSIADAVSLLYMDSPTKEQLSKMDLYMVQEIKKPKDGAMEIKFFDRLKALEKIAQSREDTKQVSSSLVEALYQGAQKISDCAGESIEL